MEPKQSYALLSFIADKFQLTLTAVYLSGKENAITDTLSRNNISLFYSLCPQVYGHQTEVPAPLVKLLVGLHPDWNSIQWTNLWNATFP